MSASKDKLLRRQQREAGIDKRAEAKAKEDALRRKNTIIYATVAVVLVLLIAFVFIYNSALPSRTLTAVTIGDEDYSVAELNYFYSNTYQNFYNTYYSYIQYGMMFDPSMSIADQDYSEEQTWREYFLDVSLDDMKQIQVLCDAAEDAGFTTLPEDYQAQYDQACESLENDWEANGYSSQKQFINMVYGKGVDYEMVKEQMYRSLLASAYAQEIYDSYEYAESELDGYYAENARDLDFVEFSYYFFSDVEGEEITAEQKAAELCEAVNGTDAETFSAYVSENYGAEAYESISQGSGLSVTYSDWLLDEARVAGEATMVQAESGSWYVVMFLNRDDNNYPARAFRHILINAVDSDGDGVYSDEEVQEAVASAESLLEEWKAGEATEDSFAVMANLYSEDSGSNTVGGLYEDVFKNQMVPPVNDWIFDDSVQPGDTTVVAYNEGGSYTGAHVIYYVGEDTMSYADTLADSSLRSEAFNVWCEEKEAALEVTTSNLGLAAKHY